MKLIVYSNCSEVIVSTPEQEKKLLADFFDAPGMDTERDITDFDREEISEGILWLSSRVTRP